MKYMIMLCLISWNYKSSQSAEVITPGTDIVWTMIESTKVSDNKQICFTCAGLVTMGTVSAGYCGTCFGVWKATTDANYCMYYIGPSSLDYDKVRQYRIPVTCQNGGSSDTTFVVAKVTPNTPPYFDQSLSETLDVASPTIGQELIRFTAVEVDTLDQPLTFTLQPNPYEDKFQLTRLTGTTAKLSPTTDLTEVCEDQIVLKVMVSDNFNPPVGPVTVTVVLNNVAPQVTSMNREIQWAENKRFYQYFRGSNVGSAGGTCTITSDPATYAADINTGGCASTITVNPYYLQNGNGYDFETDPPVNFTMVYKKGKCPSKPVWVYVRWTNVNEKPVLDLNKDAYSAQEGMIDVLPDYILTDQDAGDTHTYKIVTPINQRDPAFEIDEKTGRIYTTQYYTVTAETVDKTFDVAVTDKAGLTSDTKVVTITISDANDNSPTLDAFGTTYSFTECEDPKPVFGQLTAQDKDFGLNGEVEFVPAKSVTMSLDAAGNLILENNPIDKQFDSINIQAVDKGTPSRVSEIREISVIGLPCPYTTPPVIPSTYPTTQPPTLPPTTEPPTTTPPPPETSNWWDDPTTVILVALAGLLAFILFVLAACCLVRCCGGCSKASPKGNMIQPQKYHPNNMSGKASNKTPRNPADSSQTPRTQNGKQTADGDNESGYSEGGEEFYLEERGPGGDEYIYGGGEGQVVGSPDGGADYYWKEHYSDRQLAGHPDRRALPATVDF
ncbi:protocadherin beta-7 [Patella vulgata]|uniref:protocadherin beta-7 n=1 Tax=Patella vulgata TaxID=6465 RepID=UPI0024A99865|nr:protocadherin beta-7 [Patella vulgata]